MNTEKRENINKDNYEYVNLTKTFYGTYVGIYDARIKRAIKRGVQLMIEIPQGIGIHDPKEWIKTGKKIEKVFNYPENPMIQYCNYVKVTIPNPLYAEKYKKMKEVIEDKQIALKI
jgi:hypothetical protein